MIFLVFIAVTLHNPSQHEENIVADHKHGSFSVSDMDRKKNEFLYPAADCSTKVGLHHDYSNLARNSSSVNRQPDIPLDISVHSGANGDDAYDEVPSSLPEEGPSYLTLNGIKREYDARAYSAPLKISTPTSPLDSESSSSRKTSLHSFQYCSSTPSPDGRDSVDGIPPSRRYRRIRPCEKYTTDYRIKRERNNEAVKRSRLKSKCIQEQTKSRYLELEEENRQLKRQLETAQRRADVAEKQKDYLQSVLSSIAKPKNIN